MSDPENPAIKIAPERAMVRAPEPAMPPEQAIGKRMHKLSWTELMSPLSGVVAGVPYNHRVVASASYLSAFSGFWLIVPAAVYLWKGRQDRFVGFHAVQAVFLQVALIPIVFVGLGVATAIGSLIVLINPNLVPLAGFLSIALMGFAVTVPSAATVWLGMCALRGQPRELPLLGRWARAVVRDV